MRGANGGLVSERHILRFRFPSVLFHDKSDILKLRIDISRDSFARAVRFA